MKGGSELADEKTERLRCFHISLIFLFVGMLGSNLQLKEEFFAKMNQRTFFLIHDMQIAHKIYIYTYN